MRNFFKIMRGDLLKENFTVKEFVVYGIVVPLVFFIAIGVIGYIFS